MSKELNFETIALRTGIEESQYQEHSEALYLTSSFKFKSAKEAAAKFSGDEAGYFYTRAGNPSINSFQQRLAVLEGGEAAVATSSGMSAILVTMMGVLSAGDHVVCSRSVFGTTTILFTQFMSKFGISFDFVSLTALDEWRDAIKPKTKLLFAETPSNPLTELVDIQALADIAHEKNCLLAIDNCFCTPALQQPLKLGADIVIHSATKYIDGQGRCLGGAVVANEELVKDFDSVVRTAGMVASPFSAWVFNKGLETLNIRMKAHCENALHLAQWLANHEKVSKVYYPGLTSHPQHELASQQQSNFGAIVSFEVKGGQKEAWQVLDSTQVISITANLGDAKTTITHPASTTHGRLSEEDREKANIADQLIRLSVGIENVEDLKADLETGLSRV